MFQEPALMTCNGFCDVTSKKISIAKLVEEHDEVVDNLELSRNEIIRHELIHAILYECGLYDESWGTDEEIVDWIAIMFPKMLEIFNQAGVI